MIQNALHMFTVEREGLGGMTSYWPVAIAQLDNRNVPSKADGGTKI